MLTVNPFNSLVESDTVILEGVDLDLWGICPLTGFPVMVTLGNPHPQRMKLLYRQLGGNFWLSEDGGKVWKRTENPNLEKVDAVIG